MSGAERLVLPAGRRAGAEGLAAPVPVLGHLLALTTELQARVASLTAQLADANQELDAFSHSVAHDLKAPLRIIDGFSQILLDGSDTRLAPDSRRQLQLINNSACQMAALIDSLVEFARLSRAELRIRDLRLAPIVSRVIDDLRAGPPIRDLDISVGPLPECRGDENLIQLVFAKLLSNAVKYSAGRARPIIAVGSAIDEDAGPYFFVRDNGVGFDSRYADKLFGVFQRLHRAEDYPGTGMGLAVVQRIVHRHGGRVWAESAPEAGATFHFTLGSRR